MPGMSGKALADALLEACPGLRVLYVSGYSATEPLDDGGADVELLQKPHTPRELLRRALWALNDESATNGAYVLPAIGEIGRRAPDLAEPFVGPMTAYLWDEGLRPGILQALCRIAAVAPELIDGVRQRLLALEETDDTGERECLEFLLSVNRESVDGE